MNLCESSVQDTTASSSNEEVQGTQAPANPTQSDQQLLHKAEMHIEKVLQVLAERHGKVRNALFALAGHGNETAFTKTTQESGGPLSLDKNRFEVVEDHLLSYWCFAVKRTRMNSSRN